MSTVSDVIDDKDRQIERLKRRIEKLERLLYAISRDPSSYRWYLRIIYILGKRRRVQLAREARDGR